MSLISHADQLQKKAHALIAEYSLRELAEKHFGNFHLVGAAATGLMYVPDIDTNILLNPLDTNKILNFIDELLQQETAKIVLYNKTHTRKPHLIVNLEKLQFEGETWTVTFFIAPKDYNGAIEYTQEIKKRLIPEKRTLILKLKQFRAEQDLERKISSPLIYKTVLDKKVDTFKKAKRKLLHEKTGLEG